MRAAICGLFLALGSTGLGWAGDIDDPVWLQAPDRSDWAKAYPAQAAQSGTPGAVKVHCQATAEGTLQNCTVIEEFPLGQGFGAAALSLAGGMQLKPMAQDGQPVSGRDVVVPIRFTPELLHSSAFIGPPDWLRKPTNDEMLQYWPASAGGQAGKAAISCVITNRGLLDACRIISESPLGHGFGSAAVAMSTIFQMRPMTIDGLPVGGEKVEIPLTFEGGASSDGPAISVMRTAAWSAAPTPDALAKAFPKAAVGKTPAAHVTLRCAFTNDGSLKLCDVVSEQPEHQGFAHAARDLSQDFKAIVDPKVDNLPGLRVDVPFDFRDPSQPAPPIEIYNPIWIRTFTAQAIVELYPDAALKAGVQQGLGVVDCTVAHDGTLTHCSVAKEDPQGLGFGDAAMKAAAVMQMTPWTEQGTPVDGARISLPIRFIEPPETPAPATGAPPVKP